MKRLLLDNVDDKGDIDTEVFVRAILQYRNTPDPDSGISPAEVVFGRPLRDVLPIPPRSQIFESSRIKPEWKTLWENREVSLEQRFKKQNEALKLRTRHLEELVVGDICRIQNQTGQFPTR